MSKSAGGSASSVSSTVMQVAAQVLSDDMAGNVTEAAPLHISSVTPVWGASSGASAYVHEAKAHEQGISVPYLIMALCSLLAAAILHMSPEPTRTLYDTAAAVDFEYPIVSSRALSRAGSEYLPLRTDRKVGDAKGAGTPSGGSTPSSRGNVASLYRLRV